MGVHVHVCVGGGLPLGVNEAERTPSLLIFRMQSGQGTAIIATITTQTACALPSLLVCVSTITAALGPQTRLNVLYGFVSFGSVGACSRRSMGLPQRFRLLAQ